MDFRSDQFSLGAILYEMATGKRAFQRKTGAETLVGDHPRGARAARRRPRRRLPAPLRWIVERCLAKDPEERYASTQDLARDLESVRDHLSETSASGGLEAAAPRESRRRGWLAPGVAGARSSESAAGFLLRSASRAPDAAPASELSS